MIFLVVFLLGNSSCKNEDGNNLVPSRKHKFQEEYLSIALKNRLSEGYEGSYCNTFFRYSDTLSYYYGKTGYTPLWTKQLRKPERLLKLFSMLSGSYLHGLDSNWYHLPLLRLLGDSCEAVFDQGDTIDYSLLAEVEFILSDALLGYSTHLQNGVFDPSLIFPEDYLLPQHNLDSSSYFGIFSAKDPIDYISGLQPHDKRYTELQGALKTYREYAKQGAWEEVPFNYEVRPKIIPGDTSYILPLVAARLKATGMLDTDYNPDSTQVYDSTLSSAVKRFQSIFGILPDGVIGTRTVREMNMSVEERIRLLEINLERFRWMRYPKEGKFVRVNIPDFHFYSFKDGQPVDTMKVCLGTPKPSNYDERLQRFIETGKNRPPNMETPCMHSKYSYVVLNPRWYIPRSIAENEIFWSVLKDTSYLRKEHIRVYQDGLLLDPDSINWKDYRGKKLPFNFVQDPGRFNSLGIIKFIFWNKFSIFMHDTPAKSAFNLSMRAVSHGCMRLEQPLELAEFLLEDNEDWPMDRVRINMGLLPEEKEDTALARRFRELKEERELLLQEKQIIPSTRIRPKAEVQLFVDYYTAWVDGNGVLQFRPDVYRKDRLMAEWFGKYIHGIWPAMAEEPIVMAQKGV